MCGMIRLCVFDGVLLRMNVDSLFVISMLTII